MDAIHCSKYNITISIFIETLVMLGGMGKVFMKWYLYTYINIQYSYIYFIYICRNAGYAGGYGECFYEMISIHIRYSYIYFIYNFRNAGYAGGYGEDGKDRRSTDPQVKKTQPLKTTLLWKQKTKSSKTCSVIC